MAESTQRVLKRRLLGGQHPYSPAEINTWFKQTARAWSQQPTPFVGTASAGNDDASGAATSTPSVARPLMSCNHVLPDQAAAMNGKFRAK